MTQEQKDLFISAATLGVACGLMHPIEWYMNYIRSLMNFAKYEDIPNLKEKMTEVFIEFYKMTGGGPGDPIENLTIDGFVNLVNDYYK